MACRAVPGMNGKNMKTMITSPHNKNKTHMQINFCSTHQHSASSPALILLIVVVVVVLVVVVVAAEDVVKVKLIFLLVT